MHDSSSFLSTSSSSSEASPPNLQSLCLEVIVERLQEICVEVTAKFTDTPYPDVYPPQFTILRFPRKEVYFHSGLAETLLVKLGERGKLTDQVMTLFDSRVTHLKTVRLKDASQLTTPGLKSLRGHKIVELEANGLTKATVTDLITCLSDWSVQNLRSLNVTDSTFVDQNKYMIVVSLSKLRNLQSLSVCGTEFNKTSLEMVVDDLPLLESIDISLTKVNDISCLRKCKHRLKALTMHGLKFPAFSGDAVVDILSQLYELRQLDISEESASAQFPVMFEESAGKLKTNELLKRTDILQKLVSLDISGKSEIELETLKTFVQSHASLRYLGLVFTDVCKEEIFVTSDGPDCFPNLVVSGSGCETQVVEALKRYLNRPHYTQNSLYNLFRLTQGLMEPRVDLVQLVITSAEQHRTVFVVQMAATACLYNLSKGEIGEKLHPRILRDIVNVDLNAMEQFPQHQQLQKNVLLTICSDRILQEVNFNRFRCAKLVMDCLYTWQNHSMNRMSVAICSILAAKISTRETSQLGSSPNYMQKLLKLVQKRADDVNIDVTLKFTLSALWNLTDESPRTCSVFLEEGGLDLYLRVLRAFPEETPVQTKVLGLLNNIAEVEMLRSNLMVDEFVSLLSTLMNSNHIDVSYFAAGIVAHLASDCQENWNVNCISKPAMMRDLFNIVSGWETPKDEMVAYRSFKPFYQLMSTNQLYAVQMWAIWAINQVCSKNPQRYCPMLDEMGSSIIVTLMKHESTHHSVAKLCLEVVTVLVANGYLSESVIGSPIELVVVGSVDRSAEGIASQQ